MALTACGGEELTELNPIQTPSPTSTPTSIPEPTPTSTPEPTPTSTPEPTPTSTPTSVSSKPNILLIIADDLGLDSSAQYDVSTDLPTTPTLNTLASNGLVFDNAWATPACTTTRGSLITGLHGVNSGVDFVPAIMDPTLLTLQRNLTNQAISAEYASAIIGKWHLAGGNPDINHPNESGVPYYSGNISGTLTDYYNWPVVTNGVESVSDVYHTTAVTDMALNWINEQSSPWFMWLAYVAPHSPFHLPPDNLQNRDLSGTTADINANRREYYLAAIEAMDTEIGRLIDSLPEEDKDNTLIIFIGDNGTPSLAVDTSVFLRTKAKNTLYEGGIRVPMIISGSGVTRTGERESALVNTVDIYQTVLEAAGADTNADANGISFYPLLGSNADTSITRDYNYSEFVSENVTGWTTRNSTYKLIVFADGSQELYNVVTDLSENNNLIANGIEGYESIIEELTAYGAIIRNETSLPPITDDAEDITNAIFTNTNANCEAYVKSYTSVATDINNGTVFNGDLTITVEGDQCVFSTNAIPNHDFNDGDNDFANPVAAQNDVYTISASPEFAENTSNLLLTQDNALMLNGVKVDLLAAACFGVGDEKIGCNDIDQPWRFDPVFSGNTFAVDSHNAHTQPDGTYHYHGKPNALFDESSVSTIVGFAADGFPIFSSYINDAGTVRKSLSSFRLKSGTRPAGEGEPGGTYDGTYRDDYEYVEGVGDLDECNGMTLNGVYGYYITDDFPYILSCFKGTPDASFLKRAN